VASDSDVVLLQTSYDLVRGFRIAAEANPNPEPQNVSNFELLSAGVRTREM